MAVFISHIIFGKYRKLFLHLSCNKRMRKKQDLMQQMIGENNRLYQCVKNQQHYSKQTQA